MTNGLPFRPGIDQLIIALHVSPTARKCACPVRVIQLHVAVAAFQYTRTTVVVLVLAAAAAAAAIVAVVVVVVGAVGGGGGGGAAAAVVVVVVVVFTS